MTGNDAGRGLRERAEAFYCSDENWANRSNPAYTPVDFLVAFAQAEVAAALEGAGREAEGLRAEIDKLHLADSHYVDIVVRRDGKDEHYDGGWLKRLPGYISVSGPHRYWQDRAEQAQARAAALEGALAEYGEHKYGCPGRAKMGACTCGFDAARAALQAGGEKEKPTCPVSTACDVEKPCEGCPKEEKK